MISFDDTDAAILADVFESEGASTLLWEPARRCSCWSKDTRQPDWNHDLCGGYGVLYGQVQLPDDQHFPMDPTGPARSVTMDVDLGGPRQVKGIFRSQSRWFSPRAEGELEHGEASLTLPVDVKPNYVDRRVRDRFTVINAVGDAMAGRVFFPAAAPVPFMFGDQHLGWRVQLQMLREDERTKQQP